MERSAQLVVAGAIGALAASVFRLGVLEILIVTVVLLGICWAAGSKGVARARRR